MFWKKITPNLKLSLLGIGLVSLVAASSFSLMNRGGSKVLGVAEISPQKLTLTEKINYKISTQSLSSEVVQHILKVSNKSKTPVQSAKTPTTSNKTVSTISSAQAAEYLSLGDNAAWTGVNSTDIPTITGNVEADNKIRSLAEKRGYKRRPEATGVGNNGLQPQAQQAFNNLKAAAKKEGLNLVMVSGYRSTATQRDIFMGILKAKPGYSIEAVINGQMDAVINGILNTRSIPGYSKHHTGYAFDLGCDSSNLTNFKNTTCYTWISKNNYQNAKQFGVIPSYPPGGVNMGPAPEEWEYLWVPGV